MVYYIIGFITWLALALAVAYGAKNKGRSFGTYLALAIFLSPLISGIILLVMGEDKEGVENNSISEGNSRKCPYCAEIIKKEAIVCRYCGKELPKEEEKEKIKTYEIKDGYELKSNGNKQFAIVKNGNPDDYYCPNCYYQVNPNRSSCPNCNQEF